MAVTLSDEQFTALMGVVQSAVEAAEEAREEAQEAKERVRDLEETAGRERGEMNARINDLEERESAEPEGPGIEASDYTPAGRVALLGEEVTSTKRDLRAATIFEHFYDWGEKAPAGYVLHSGKHEVLEKLSAHREERLTDWNTVYRAFEALDELAGDYIEHKPEKNLLVLHDTPPLHRAQADGAATPSSVVTTG